MPVQDEKYPDNTQQNVVDTLSDTTYAELSVDRSSSQGADHMSSPSWVGGTQAANEGHTGVKPTSPRSPPATLFQNAPTLFQNAQPPTPSQTPPVRPQGAPPPTLPPLDLSPVFDLTPESEQSWRITTPDDVRFMAGSDDAMAGAGRFFQAVVPDGAQGRSYTEVSAALDAFTAEAVLEEIARGLLPVEFAARYNIPFMHFDKWLASPAVDSEELARATRIAADVYAARSRAVLEMTPGSAGEASMMREYSKRALEMAERIAPDTWATRKRTDDNTGVTGTTIQIAVMAPPGSIPGVELLSGSKPAIQLPARDS